MSFTTRGPGRGIIASVTNVTLAALVLGVGALAVWVARIAKRVGGLMAKFEDVDAALNEIDAETDRIAEDVEALKAEIAGSGMNSDQEAIVQGRLDALASRLRGIGKDPENPIPEEPV